MRERRCEHAVAGGKVRITFDGAPRSGGGLGELFQQQMREGKSRVNTEQRDFKRAESNHPFEVD